MTGIITNMVMPKIEREAEARNYGKFIISPLEGGYGVTLGNALRRVLLSSLEGSAIASMRVADVLHEFSDIPGVREVRGMGLMIGIEMKQKVAPYIKALQERHIIALNAGMTVIRLLPPLVITYEQIDHVVQALAEVLTEVFILTFQ